MPVVHATRIRQGNMQKQFTWKMPSACKHSDQDLSHQGQMLPGHTIHPPGSPGLQLQCGADRSALQVALGAALLKSQLIRLALAATLQAPLSLQQLPRPAFLVNSEQHSCISNTTLFITLPEEHSIHFGQLSFACSQNCMTALPSALHKL